MTEFRIKADCRLFIYRVLGLSICGYGSAMAARGASFAGAIVDSGLIAKQLVNQESILRLKEKS